jgi:hypothetical protein
MSAAIHPVPDDFNARIGKRELAELHDFADGHADRFWLDQARRLEWTNFPTKAGDWSFDEADFGISWYADGKLNLSVNCLDRHLAEHGDRTALIFEADDPGDGRRVTYRELCEETCRFANLLRERGETCPAVIITSNPTRAIRQRTGKAGAVLIEKPLLTNGLTAAIRALIDARGAGLARSFDRVRESPI